MHWIALQPGPEARAGAATPMPPASSLPDVWSALAWWALQFTPRVVRLDDALLLEVSGSERLWGGMAGLRRLLFEEKAACGGAPRLWCDILGCQSAFAARAFADPRA